MTPISVAYLDVSTVREQGPPEYATVESTDVNQAGILGTQGRIQNAWLGRGVGRAKGTAPSASEHV